MAKFFVKAPDGSAYTALVDSSAKAQNKAVSRYIGTHERQMPFKGFDKVGEKMVQEGISVASAFYLSGEPVTGRT